jgi:hypothetical protein
VSGPVDLDDLTLAFEDASPTLSYFVDRETGEVILVSDTLGFIEAAHQRAAMAEAPGRYVPVPVSTLDDFIEDVEAFIDEIDDEQLQIDLDDALGAVDVRKRIAAVLARDEGVEAAWKRFRQERFRERAAAWISANDLDAGTTVSSPGGTSGYPLGG